MNDMYIKIEYKNGDNIEYNMHHVSIYQQINHLIITRYDEKEQTYISQRIQLNDINIIKVYTKG